MDRVQFLEHTYTRESRFSYDCHACKRCCHDKIIKVNPYEVARLAGHLGLSTTEFLSRYTSTNGTTLKQTDLGACVFLTAEGCGVHEARPLVCRLYPLGRRVSADGAETFREVMPHPHTEGIYGTQGTVEEFLTKQGAKPFIDAVERYVALVGRMADKIRTLIRQDNTLDSAIKDIVEHCHDPESSDVPSWVDLDQAVERFCTRHQIEVPTNVERRMTLHVQAIEEWIGHSSSHQGGAHDGEG